MRILSILSVALFITALAVRVLSVHPVEARTPKTVASASQTLDQPATETLFERVWDGTSESWLEPPQKQSWSAWLAGLPSSLAQRLRTAAGGGRRDVIIPRSTPPEQLAIWTADMPARGQLVPNDRLRLSIKAAITPAWSANGEQLAASKWMDQRWVIAVYQAVPQGEFPQKWKWVSSAGGTDFSPLWSPDEKQIAFIRQDSTGKGDIWLLEIGPDATPQRERRLTRVGKVLQLLGWDAEEGILYEAQSEGEGNTASEFWSLPEASRASDDNPRRVTLTIAPAAVRGRTPPRNSAVYAIEFSGRSSDQPSARIFEVDSGGRRSLLRSVPQSDRWPDVTADGKRLAFSSNRPQGQ